MRDIPDGLVDLLPFIRDMHNTRLERTNRRPETLFVPLRYIEIFKAVYDVYGMKVRFATHWEVE